MHSRLASTTATAAFARAPVARGFHASGAAQAKKTIQQLAKEVPLKGQSVFVRADLNVPVKNGVVKDKTRIVLSAPTIRFLLDQGAKVYKERPAARTHTGLDQELDESPTTLVDSD